MVQHHLDDATLIRYASGDLDEAFSVVVAAHVAMCEHCRNAVRAAEEIGGHLLDGGETADLSDGAMERLMRQIGHDDGHQPSPAPAERAANRAGHDDHDGNVPVPLRRFTGPSLKDLPWKRVAPGVRKHTIALSSPAKSSLYMLSIAPDKVVPEHGHGGAEITLVLSGAYRDELGRFGPGDIADLDEHIEHQPRVESGEPCICIVATEAPTRFKGLVSRLLQPFVRI